MIRRLEDEFTLLRLHYSRVEHIELNGLHWFLTAPIRMPTTCSPLEADTVFSVTQGYPGAEPYGFFVPKELRVHGEPPNEHAPPHQPPFPGEWRFLSWAPVGWRATADVQTGSNLWGWVRSFPQRLREGR